MPREPAQESLNTSTQSASQTAVDKKRAGPSRVDLDLVERSQRGDQAAFQQLVERYQWKVYSVAYGYCRNREDALDRVQEAFVKAYRNIGGFQATSSFYTWLYRVTANVCIDFLRREKRHRYGVDYDDGIQRRDTAETQWPTSGSMAHTNPDKALRNRELGDQLQKAVEKLSESHRDSLLLREIDGLSYEELAEVLDIPKGTVMSRLHHARNQLKKTLSGYAGG